MNAGQQVPYRSASYDRFLLLVSLRGYRFNDLQDRFSMPLDTVLAVVENKVFGDVGLLYNVSMDLCRGLGDDYREWFKSLVRDRGDKQRVSRLAIGHAQPLD